MDTPPKKSNIKRSILKKPSPLRAVHPDIPEGDETVCETSQSEQPIASHDMRIENDDENSASNLPSEHIKVTMRPKLERNLKDSFRVSSDRLSSSSKSKFLKRRKRPDSNSPGMSRIKESETNFPFPPAQSHVPSRELSSPGMKDTERGRCEETEGQRSKSLPQAIDGEMKTTGSDLDVEGVKTSGRIGNEAPAVSDQIEICDSSAAVETPIKNKIVQKTNVLERCKKVISTRKKLIHDEKPSKEDYEKLPSKDCEELSSKVGYEEIPSKVACKNVLSESDREQIPNIEKIPLDYFCEEMSSVNDEELTFGMNNDGIDIEKPLVTYNKKIPGASREIEKGIGEEIPFDTSNEILLDTGKDVPLDTGEEVPIDTGEEVPLDTGEDLPQDTGKQIAIDTAEEESLDIGEEELDTCEQEPLDTCEQVPLDFGEKISNEETSLDVNEEISNFPCERFSSEVEVEVRPLEEEQQDIADNQSGRFSPLGSTDMFGSDHSQDADDAIPVNRNAVSAVTGETIHPEISNADADSLMDYEDEFLV